MGSSGSAQGTTDVEIDTRPDGDVAAGDSAATSETAAEAAATEEEAGGQALTEEEGGEKEGARADSAAGQAATKLAADPAEVAATAEARNDASEKSRDKGDATAADAAASATAATIAEKEEGEEEEQEQGQDTQFHGNTGATKVADEDAKMAWDVAMISSGPPDAEDADAERNVSATPQEIVANPQSEGESVVPAMVAQPR